MSWMKRPARAAQSPSGAQQGSAVPHFNPNAQQIQWNTQLNQTQPQTFNQNTQQQNWLHQSQPKPPTPNSYGQLTSEQIYWQNNIPQPGANTGGNAGQQHFSQNQLNHQHSVNYYQNQNIPQNDYSAQYIQQNNMENVTHPSYQHVPTANSYFNMPAPNQYPGHHPNPTDSSVRPATPKTVSGRNSVPGFNHSQTALPFQPEVNETDPWNWGWEDNSNQNQQQRSDNSLQQQIKNQANIIASSFSTSENDDNWNWSVEENAAQQAQLKQSQANSQMHSSSLPKVGEPVFETVGSFAQKHKEISTVGEDYSLQHNTTVPKSIQRPSDALQPDISKEGLIDQLNVDHAALISRHQQLDKLKMQQRSTESHMSQDSIPDSGVRTPLNSAADSRNDSLIIDEDNLIKIKENVLDSEINNYEYNATDHRLRDVNVSLQHLNLNSQQQFGTDNTEIIDNSPLVHKAPIASGVHDARELTYSNKQSQPSSILNTELVNLNPITPTSNVNTMHSLNVTATPPPPVNLNAITSTSNVNTMRSINVAATPPPPVNLNAMMHTSNVNTMRSLNVAATPPPPVNLNAITPTSNVNTMRSINVAATPPPPVNLNAITPTSNVNTMRSINVAATPPPPVNLNAITPTSNVNTLRSLNVNATPPPPVNVNATPSINMNTVHSSNVSATPPVNVNAISNMNVNAVNSMPPANVNTTPPSSKPPSVGVGFSNSGNPFKRSSLKNAYVSPSPYVPDGVRQYVAFESPNYTSPFQVNQEDLNQEINLESLPDNSERPDLHESRNAHTDLSVGEPIVTVNQIAVENLEIAPRNDRNEYLQTGHLSESELNQPHPYQEYNTQPNSENLDSYPPPGLSRLVLGQPESNIALLGSGNDEPPPGLDRMVPGQLTDMVTSNMDRQVDGQTENDANSAPQVLSSNKYSYQRTIPGESSGAIYQQPNSYQSFQNDSLLNEERVVTGLEHTFEDNLNRKQSLVGSEMHLPLTQLRDVNGFETSITTMRSQGLETRRSVDMDGANSYDSGGSDQQRELSMDGENLQDQQRVNDVPVDLPREERVDGANVQDDDSQTAGVSIPELANRAQSLVKDETDHRKHREDTTDDSEKEKRYRESRHEKEKSRHRDKDDRRYRGDYNEKTRRYDLSDQDYRDIRGSRDVSRETYNRDVRDPEKDRRSKDRKISRDKRYETEDTDYYSDRERRKARREGSVRDKDRDKVREKYERERDREKYERDRVGSVRDKDRDKYERDRDGRVERERRYPRGRDGRDHRDKDERRGERSDRRYDYDDPYFKRSGSRTGSDRDRPVDVRGDRERGKRSRDYNPYYQQAGYTNYDYTYYAQQQSYQYYENLRRTNPQAYAEWYHKYYANRQPGSTNVYAQPEYNRHGNNLDNADDRASVHSGRSSTTDKDRYMNVSLQQQYYMGMDYYQRQHHNLSYPHLDQSLSFRSQSQSELSDINFRDLKIPTTDSSLNLNLETSTIASQRLTPAKFPTAHIKSSLNSGHLVTIMPSYPSDGRPLAVEVHNVNVLMTHDPLCKELTNYSGPLVRGVTHKKTVMEFCEERLNRYEGHRAGDSYELMWELMILLLRQNGMVIGTDIAELLMKHSKKPVSMAEIRAESRNSVLSSNTINSRALDDPVSEPEEGSADKSETKCRRTSAAGNITNKEVSKVSEKCVTDKFREYLIYGSGKEALEWAMSNGLWGHALFLASKLDKRTYANVMMRFANGLPFNDPLQTLYQLMSGRQPAVVTCALDDKWGDWKPHLAMILSNTTQRPDCDRKAITTLGDTLMSKGDLYAAHFCYLMAQVSFGKYSSDSAQNCAKLVLLGSCHLKSDTFLDFATNEAIMLTEVYEYACTLSDANFVIVDFQPFKYLLATRMLDYGLHEKALLYMEKISQTIQTNPSRYEPVFINRVYELGDRLKFYDPVDRFGDINDEDANSTEQDQAWLQGLNNILKDYDMGILNHESSSLQSLTQATSELDLNNKQATLNDSYQQPQSEVPPQQQYYQQQQQQLQTNTELYQQQYADIQQDPSEPVLNIQNTYEPIAQNVGALGDNYGGYISNSGQPDAVVYGGYAGNDYSNQLGVSVVDNSASTDWGRQNSHDANEGANEYWGQQQNMYQHEPDVKPDADSEPTPQISMPNASPAKKQFMEDGGNRTDTNKSEAKPKLAKDVAKGSSSSSGWFGGIWNKLSMRPKNQMILPDDKNPTIVWDPDRKKWTNVDGEEDASSEFKPPPKMTDMISKIPGALQQNGSIPVMPLMNQVPLQQHQRQQQHQQQQQQQHMLSNPRAATFTDMQPEPVHKQPSLQSNMFKLQRNRTLKKSYVDVFNPNGTASPPPVVPLGPSMPAMASVSPLSSGFFIPAPMPDQDSLPTDFLTQATSNDDGAPQKPMKQYGYQ